MKLIVGVQAIDFSADPSLPGSHVVSLHYGCEEQCSAETINPWGSLCESFIFQFSRDQALLVYLQRKTNGNRRTIAETLKIFPEQLIDSESRGCWRGTIDIFQYGSAYAKNIGKVQVSLMLVANSLKSVVPAPLKLEPRSRPSHLTDLSKVQIPRSPTSLNVASELHRGARGRSSSPRVLQLSRSRSCSHSESRPLVEQLSRSSSCSHSESRQHVEQLPRSSSCSHHESRLQAIPCQGSVAFRSESPKIHQRYRPVLPLPCAVPPLQIWHDALAKSPSRHSSPVVARQAAASRSHSGSSGHPRKIYALGPRRRSTSVKSPRIIDNGSFSPRVELLQGSPRRIAPNECAQLSTRFHEVITPGTLSAYPSSMPSSVRARDQHGPIRRTRIPKAEDRVDLENSSSNERNEPLC